MTSPEPGVPGLGFRPGLGIQAYYLHANTRIGCTGLSPRRTTCIQIHALVALITLVAFFALVTLLALVAFVRALGPWAALVALVRALGPRAALVALVRALGPRTALGALVRALGQGRIGCIGSGPGS